MTVFFYGQYVEQRLSFLLNLLLCNLDAFLPVDAAVDVRAVVAVLLAVGESSEDAVLDVGLTVEAALGARFREIRVIVAESVSVAPGVVFQSALRPEPVEFRLEFRRCRFVGLLKRAFAVPAVPWMMFVPKRVADRQREASFPKGAVRAFGCWRCGRHQAQVWHHVLVAFEPSPVGGVMCPYERRVVLRAQPCPDMVRRDGGHFLRPFAERLELSVRADEPGCHEPPHVVHLERGENLVGMPQRGIEACFVGRRRPGFGKPLHRGGVDDAQDLAPHGRLDSGGRIESPIYLAHERGQHIGGERKGSPCRPPLWGGEVGMAAGAVPLDIIQAVNVLDCQAPGCSGAMPKKPFKRCLNDF